MQRRVAGLLSAIALVVAACSAGQTPPAGPTAANPAEPTNPTNPTGAAASSTAAPTPARLTLDGEPLVECRIGGSYMAMCGSLSVPEDRTAEGGRTIELKVAVIPASASVPKPDPFFMLAGGPGGAATESLAWAVYTYDGIHATRDIVLVDQRGTGGSNRLTSGEPPDVTGQSDAEADATIRAWVDELLRALPGDPRFYTTSVAMDDLDDVRAALGYDRINLYGGSYGATAAQYYIRQYEEHLRTVVLDGATLIDVPIFELIAANSQRALDGVFARCAAAPACARAFPDLEGDLDRAIELLAEGPIMTDVPNPATGQPVVMDQDTLVGAVHGALLSADTAASVPLLIHGAAEAHWNDVAAGIMAGSGGRVSDDDPLVMSAVIRCSEAWAAFDPNEVERRGAGSYLVEAQAQAARDQERSCRYTPDGLVPADDATPARTDVPVLLVVGEADPQDPPTNVASAAQDFPNSLTVVVPGHGHTVAHLGCVPRIVDAFIEAGSVDDLDASCAAEGVPVPPFRLP